MEEVRSLNNGEQGENDVITDTSRQSVQLVYSRKPEMENNRS